MKKIFFFFLFLLTFSDSYTQNGWFVYNDFSDIMSVKFYDANTGWAAGRYGMIVKTTNGGINWVYQANPAYGDIACISVVNQNTCVAVSMDGKVFRTSDGGAHWSGFTLNTSTSCSFVYFLDQNNGWISSSRGLYRTTNSGLNWNVVSGLSFIFYGMKFFSLNNGIAINGDGNFLKTTNGGVNWTSVTIPYSGMRYFSFLNESTGFCTGSTYVLKTTNGGTNWSPVYTTNADWSGFEFLNANTGFGATTGRKIFKTTDGGYSWLEKYPGESGVSASNCFAVIDMNNIFSGGVNRGILKSTDGGNNWYASFNNNLAQTQIYDLSFPDENNGFILSGLGKMYKTTNNGSSWNLLPIVNVNNSASLCFVNANTGFLATAGYFWSSSSLLKTTNGGLNWTPSTEIYSVQMNTLYFLNQNTGWAGGEYVDGPTGITEGVTYKTTNAGLNWTPSTHFYSDISVSNVYFYNENTGWVVCFEITASGGAVLRTTNGGSTYAGVYSSNPPPVSVGFADSVNGFIVGGPRISKTTNCGLNWTVTTYPDMSFFEVKFINQNTGWILGSPKIMMKTTNKGLNWTSYDLGPGNIPFRMKFLNANTGYILDYSGNVYKTTNGGVSFVSGTGNLTAGDYYLNQNFPNPFNNSTRISFGIKSTAMCKLKVYDAAGRLVSELLDQIVQPGEMYVSFNSSSLASGVYFYALDIYNLKDGIHQQKLSRKMVVLK